MTVTISRLYDTYAAAAEAVRSLEAAGVSHSDISLVSNNADNWYSANSATNKASQSRTVDRDRDGRDDRAEGAETGAGIGATAGGMVGLLTGLGLLAIPGVGPVVAAGWLAATAAGAAAGGAAGGILGALTQAGTSEEDARMYAEGIRSPTCRNRSAVGASQGVLRDLVPHPDRPVQGGLSNLYLD